MRPSWSHRCAAGAVVTALVGACSAAGDVPTEHPVPIPRPAHPDGSGSAAPAETSRAEQAAPPGLSTTSAWTDPYAVAELAKDCHWEPKGGCVRRSDRTFTQKDKCDESLEYSYLPLACVLAYDQACIPDPCFWGKVDKCWPACKKDCDDCAGECVKGCDSCKSACKDEPCRLACAKGCGECRQKCLGNSDRCVTGKCSEEEDACLKKTRAEWDKHNCSKLCPKLSPCIEACMEKEKDPALAFTTCQSKCMARVMPRCMGQWQMCTGG